MCSSSPPCSLIPRIYGPLFPHRFVGDCVGVSFALVLVGGAAVASCLLVYLCFVCFFVCLFCHVLC